VGRKQQCQTQQRGGVQPATSSVHYKIDWKTKEKKIIYAPASKQAAHGG